MDSLPRKRKRGAAVDRANLEHTAGLRNDGDSFQQQRKRIMEKMRDQELGSLDLNPPAASIAPPPPRRGCLPNSPERGLKRKVGCILASTRTGRKRKIEQDYDLGIELGRGRFGLVRMCKRKATGEELACKTLPKKTEENVYKEIEIMQHLSGHPNVVTLRAVYEDGEALHLVMDLCSGGRLTDEMFRTGCYSEHQAANLIKELIMVIKYCHELGVVHRDIKPENVLLTSSGQLKLADFGLSIRFAKGQTLSGVVGSPSYIAPEVLAGAYSEKVDVWGVGIVLHTLLIGILPFRGESIQAIFEAIKLVQLDFHSEEWQSISRLAKDLLSRMLLRDVEKRLSPQEVLNHPWIKFYTEPNLKIPASIPKWKNCFLAVKGQCLEESTLPLSPCKRERRAQFANSILTEYGQDESFCGPLQGFPRLRQPEINEIVDALAVAISQIKLSESKTSRLRVPVCPIPLQHLKGSLCTAF